jgi:hypothetical protein
MKFYYRRTHQKHAPAINPGRGSPDPGQAQELLPAHQASGAPAVIRYCWRAPGLARRQ